MFNTNFFIAHATLLKKQTLLDFMKENDYPASDVPLEFLTISRNFSAEMAEGVKVVQGWLDTVNKQQRVYVFISS